MSGERFTLDTNILVYVFDRNSGPRQEAAAQIVKAAASLDCILTFQALSEFFVIARRKLGMPAATAAAHVRNWLQLLPAAAVGQAAVEQALLEVESGRFSYWDALLLGTAADAGCTIALSEDMKDGARLGTIMVRAPFPASGALSRAALQLLGG